MMDLRKFSGKRICVAVSGGVDSVVLLHRIETESRTVGFSLSAVHCEHGIRGEESVADMRFVQELCARKNIPLFLFREDCPSRAQRERASLETAAREFRYECFASLVEAGKADYIATAHHRNDEAETVLFRIARGSSLTGASGMREESGYLLRPLLNLSRKTIEEIAREAGLAYREDKTNADTEYTRNKLRHEVLPKLEEAVPGATENIARFAFRAAEDDELLYAYARELVSLVADENGGTGYLLAPCDKRPLFRRAALLALKALGLDKDYTALHLEQLWNLQGLERGAKTVLPKGLEGVKTANGILLRKASAPVSRERPAPKTFDETGFDGGRYAVKIVSSLPQDSGESKILRFDAEKLPADATFRFRREGDEIEKFGGGTKSLKKFFNEKKIPVEERAYLPLIAQAEGNRVYAVCGVEIADLLKVTKETRRMLYIVLEKNQKEKIFEKVRPFS